MEREGGVGLELFVEEEVDGVFCDGGDLGAVEETVGDDVVDLAWSGAEDSSEVSGLIAGEGGCRVGPGVGDEAAAGHAASLEGWCGLFLRSGGGGFALTADEDLLCALMVKVDVEDCGAALVPDVFSDREVEEDHAFGRLAGTDHGVAKERLGGEGL